MERSKKYETAKRYYNLKMWDESRLRNAVKMNWITEAEFAEITGKAY